MTLEIYTDGACMPNPGNGGWGFVVYRDGKEIHTAKGGRIESTNQEMELTGMLEALRWLTENRQFTLIRSDSMYVVKGCNSWRHNWKRFGWRTSQKKPVSNLELWQKVSALLDAKPYLPAEISWIKGHAGHAGNERADELAMHGAAEASGIPIEELYNLDLRMRRVAV